MGIAKKQETPTNATVPMDTQASGMTLVYHSHYLMCLLTKSIID